MKVLPDSPAPAVHPLDPQVAEDIEDLFKEARQRRRRRRALLVAGVVLVLAVAATIFAVTGGDAGGPPGIPVHRVGGPRTVPSTPIPESQPPPTGGSYTAVQEIGLADNGLGWVADASGIYVTADQGLSWRAVTPPIFPGQDPSDRIDAMVGVGSTDLWLPVVDVIGLLPPTKGEASDRFNGIEHSTDGGTTWTFTALPGCLQACGADISLSFPDARHGFALEQGGGNGQQATLFSTDDGGATWAAGGSLPDIGSLDIGSGQMVFSDAHDGWVTTGPTFRTERPDHLDRRCPLPHHQRRCHVVKGVRAPVERPIRDPCVLRCPTRRGRRLSGRPVGPGRPGVRHRRWRSDVDRSPVAR